MRGTSTLSGGASVGEPRSESLASPRLIPCAPGSLHSPPPAHALSLCCALRSLARSLARFASRVGWDTEHFSSPVDDETFGGYDRGQYIQVLAPKRSATVFVRDESTKKQEEKPEKATTKNVKKA